MDCNGLVAHNGAVTPVWDDTGSVRSEAGEEALEDENGVGLVICNRGACICVWQEFGLSALCGDLFADVLG